MMQKETLDKIVTMIGRATEEELKVILDAATSQSRYLRNQRTHQAMRTLRVGDTVQLKNIRPKYINGARGQIIDRKQTKFTIQLEDGVRFRGRSSIVVVPADCLLKVDI